MKELEEYRQRARAVREETARVEDAQEKHRNLLRHRRTSWPLARRQVDGSAEESQLLLEIQALEDAIETDIRSARTLKGVSAGLTGGSCRPASPGSWSKGSTIACLSCFSPVRIETRFMTVEGR